MLAKFFALITLISSLAIFSANAHDPADPLFFIVSGGAAASVARIVLALALVAITFIQLSRLKVFRIALAIFGLPLIIVGGAGFLTNSFDFAWFGLIKPLDFLLVVETGIIMNIVAFEPRGQSMELRPFSTLQRLLLISTFNLEVKKLRSAV